MDLEHAVLDDAGHIQVGGSGDGNHRGVSFDGIVLSQGAGGGGSNRRGHQGNTGQQAGDQLGADALGEIHIYVPPKSEIYLL